MSNGSGHGRGLYASEEQAREYLARLRAYLDRRNAAWLDRNTDMATGDVRAGVGELCSLWEADDQVAQWAAITGRLDPATVPETGIKHRQIGRLSAVVYFRSESDRRALAFELARYLDWVESRLMAERGGS